MENGKEKVAGTLSGIEGLDLDAIIEMVAPFLEMVTGFDQKLDVLSAKLQILVQNQEGIYNAIIENGKKDKARRKTGPKL